MSSQLNHLGGNAYPSAIGSAEFRDALLAIHSLRPRGTPMAYAHIMYIAIAEHYGRYRLRRENVFFGSQFLFRNSQSGVSSAPENVFPLYMLRPSHMVISRASIEAIDPALADMCVNQIREALLDHTMAPRMFDGIRTFLILQSNPRVMRVVVRDPTCIGPTHMLMAYEKVSGPHPHSIVSLHPVHSIVLAAHCAKLPPLPPPINPIVRPTGIREFILPVVPICTNSHPLMGTLLEYIYKRDPIKLYVDLCNMQPATALPDFWALVKRISEAPAQDVTKILVNVTMLWDIARCLGVYDGYLWEVLDATRKIVLLAIAKRAHREDTVRRLVSVAAALNPLVHEPAGFVDEVEYGYEAEDEAEDEEE